LKGIPLLRFVGYASRMNESEATMQEAIRQLADAIYRDKVLRARREDPMQKLLDGFELFEKGLEITKLDVIRRIGTSEETLVQDALRQRFERVRQARESKLYKRLP